MSHLAIVLGFDQPFLQNSRRRRALLNAALNKAAGCVGGASRSASFDLVSSSTAPGFASSGLAVSSGSGAVGGTINGVTVTDTWATSDTVAAGLVAAAINASTDALVQHMVVASNLHSAVTLASVAAGDSLVVAGVRFTATATTPAQYDYGGFSIAGTDAQDAAALAVAINAHPALQRYVAAVPISASGVVRLFARSASWFTGPGAPPNSLSTTASTITISSSTFAAAAFVGVSSTVRGKWGNAFTLAASGTGVSTLNSEARLARGTGFDSAPISDGL